MIDGGFQLSKNNFTVSSTYGDYIVRFESFSNFKQTIDFDKFFIIDDDLKTLYNNLLSDLPIERTLIVNSSEESKSFEQSSIFLKALLSKNKKR